MRVASSSSSEAENKKHDSLSEGIPTDFSEEISVGSVGSPASNQNSTDMKNVRLTGSSTSNADIM